MTHECRPAIVGIVMGSDSDWPTMEAAAMALTEFGVAHEVRVRLRAPHAARHARLRRERPPTAGCGCIIAGAGGAAHLPGMLASVTPLPVIGVPVPLKHLDGLDSLLSIVQMPAGVPVATVSVGGARNAGLLAVRILATSDEALLRADGRRSSRRWGTRPEQGRRLACSADGRARHHGGVSAARRPDRTRGTGRVERRGRRPGRPPVLAAGRPFLRVPARR